MGFSEVPGESLSGSITFDPMKDNPDAYKDGFLLSVCMYTLFGSVAIMKLINFL